MAMFCMNINLHLSINDEGAARALLEDFIRKNLPQNSPSAHSDDRQLVAAVNLGEAITRGLKDMPWLALEGAVDVTDFRQVGSDTASDGAPQAQA